MSRNSAVLLGLALAAGVSPRPASGTDVVSKTPSPAPMQWLKIYSLAPYKERWTLTISVANLDRGRASVEKTMSEAGAVLTHPLENFPASARSQQLSYTLPKMAAERALKKLKKAGKFPPPIVLTSAEPVSLPEVREKLDRLNAERGAHLKELQAMPAVSALVAETINHLATVKKVVESTEAEVLLNITIEQKP